MNNWVVLLCHITAYSYSSPSRKYSSFSTKGTIKFINKECKDQGTILTTYSDPFTS